MEVVQSSDFDRTVMSLGVPTTVCLVSCAHACFCMRCLCARVESFGHRGIIGITCREGLMCSSLNCDDARVFVLSLGRYCYPCRIFVVDARGSDARRLTEFEIRGEREPALSMSILYDRC